MLKKITAVAMVMALGLAALPAMDMSNAFAKTGEVVQSTQNEQHPNPEHREHSVNEHQNMGSHNNNDAHGQHYMNGRDHKGMDRHGMKGHNSRHKQ